MRKTVFMLDIQSAKNVHVLQQKKDMYRYFNTKCIEL